MIRLGVIGISEGNGHPYSWSAIINGFDPVYMKDCGFEVIPRYLAQQTWPAARINGALVTHIWTQDRGRSQHIARAALINNIVDRPEDMIGHVDAILLARDDAASHLEFARPFLEVGMPIYIDKPIALSVRELDRLYEMQRNEGQIFTCSALRFAAELKPTPEALNQIGPLLRLRAESPNVWDRYAIHIIEPSLNIIGMAGEARLNSHVKSSDGRSQIAVSFENGICLDLSTLGKNADNKMMFNVFGRNGELVLEFTNTFQAFKSALEEFLEGIRSKQVKSPYEFNRRAVQLVEWGI